MKALIFFSFMLFTICSFGQKSIEIPQWKFDLPQKYISARDSVPFYGNICAVLVKGKEFNRVVGGSCPVLAQYIFQVGWVAVDSRPWKTPQISHHRFKKLNVSYWYPLPCTDLPGTANR